MSGDVLGEEPVPLRRRTVLVWVLALALGALLVGADRVQRGRERTALVRAVAAAEDVVRRSAAVGDGVRAHQAALATVLEEPPAVTPADERALAADAVRWLPRLTRAREAVADVRLLPWHRQLRAARAAHQARLAAWTDRVDRTSRDPRAALRGGAEVAATREDAVRALQAAAGGRGAAAFG